MNLAAGYWHLMLKVVFCLEKSDMSGHLTNKRIFCNWILVASLYVSKRKMLHILSIITSSNVNFTIVFLSTDVKEYILSTMFNTLSITSVMNFWPYCLNFQAPYFFLNSVTNGFLFPWDFEIAGFNCNSVNLVYFI